MPATAAKQRRSSNSTFTRKQALRINSFDPDTGRFTAIASTGAPVTRRDFFDGDYEEVLSLDAKAVRLARFQSGRAPLLDSHRANSARDQIGVITGARIEGRKLIVDGQLSRREDVFPIAEDMAAGVIGNVSVGYRVHASVETKGPGDSRVITRTDWEPLEMSIVPIGADPNAHIRSQENTSMPHARNANTRRRAPSAQTEVDDETIVDTRDHLDDGGHETIETRGAPRGNADDEPLRFNQMQERTIFARARSFGLSEADARAVIDAPNVRSVRAATDALQELSAAGNSPRQQPYLSVTRDASDGIEKAIENALYGRMTGKAQEGRAAEFMGASMLDLGMVLLEAHDVRVSRRFQRTALVDQIMTRTHGTTDFPNLLTGAGNRVLLDTYQAVQSPLLRLSRRRDANDFRTMTAIKLGDAPKLLLVREGAEVKTGTMAEAKETFRLQTFARIFGLTRHALINDDLGAFADINVAWGRAAAECEADNMVALLTANSGNGVNLDDGNPLYTTGRGNKGTAAAIDEASLHAARKAMREMKGLDGVTPIAATPKHMLVGAAKETEAEKVLADLNAAEVANVNPFSGKLTLHVEPRLSGNAWRLFADPSQLPVLTHAYLNGEAGPQTSIKDGWDVLGTEYRVVLDFGCGITEWRGTYLNPGA